MVPVSHLQPQIRVSFVLHPARRERSQKERFFNPVENRAGCACNGLTPSNAACICSCTGNPKTRAKSGVDGHNYNTLVVGGLENWLKPTDRSHSSTREKKDYRESGREREREREREHTRSPTRAPVRMKATYTEFLRVSSRTVVSSNPPRARSMTDSPTDLTADQAPLEASERARNAPYTARGNRGRAKGEQLKNNRQRRLHNTLQDYRACVHQTLTMDGWRPECIQKNCVVQVVT
jgi:hypothetical protein